MKPIIITASLRAGLLGAAALALSGCVSFGSAELPTSLLTLKPTAEVAAGVETTAGGEGAKGAIAVLAPETPAKLDVVRVPVNVTDTEIAYLQGAVWVEKPARLFRRLLGETLRTKTTALVIDSDDTPVLSEFTLRGTLREMGYHAQTSSVIVRYDAIRADKDGKAVSRRFEASESGVLPDAASIGPALNRVANEVAADATEWATAAR